jgi:hypothetical protein
MEAISSPKPFIYHPYTINYILPLTSYIYNYFHYFHKLRDRDHSAI